MPPIDDLAAEMRRNLVDLRRESLVMIAVALGAIGFIWLNLLLWPETGGSQLGATFWGAIALLAGVGLSYVLRHAHLRLAAWLLVVGSIVALAVALSQYRLPVLAYLLAIPPMVAGVLLGAGALWSLAACMLALWLAMVQRLLQLPAHSSAFVLPAMGIALVSLIAWVSERRLYTSLQWVWSGFERARQQTVLAQERRGELAGALHALKEASDRLERTNRELAIARRQADEARQWKEQFVANVSHELRTPLNLITGFAEMMFLTPERYRGARWTPALHSDVGEMYRASRHLRGLVEDILDLARIDATRLPLFREPTALEDVVDEAVQTVAPLLRPKELTCTVAPHAALPELFVDRLRIRQVLLNLLNNAIRFTDQGGITLHLCVAEDQIVVAVQDTGLGIPADERDRIFETFHQVDSGPRQRGGIGLGLALSREFVRLHGGRMWLESELGQGSTFSFSLPVEWVGRRDTALRWIASEDPRKRATQAPVVLLDADASVGAMLSRYLGDHPILSLADPALLDACVEQEHPIAIIVNHPPQAEAGEWLGPLTSLTSRYNLPIIRCSIPSHTWLTRATGLDGVLTKPVSQQALCAEIEQHTQAGATLLVVDNNPGFVSLMVRMIENLEGDYRVLTAYSGEEALRLAREQRPDLVLLDLLMPELDGFQVAAILREDPRLASVPIVAVTATSYAEESLQQRGSHLTCYQAEGLSTGQAANIMATLLGELQPSYLPTSAASSA